MDVKRGGRRLSRVRLASLGSPDRARCSGGPIRRTCCQGPPRLRRRQNRAPLTHHAFPDFWALYRSLRPELRDLADHVYARLKQDPRHLSLHFTKVGRFWSARVGAHYRALAVERQTESSGSGWAVMLTTIGCLTNNRIELTALRAAAHSRRLATVPRIRGRGSRSGRAQSRRRGLGPRGLEGYRTTDSRPPTGVTAVIHDVQHQARKNFLSRAFSGSPIRDA